MIVLRSRLLERKLAEEAEKVAKERKEQVGTGERSEKSRTYNFPQNRVTDHRVDLTLYNLSAVIEGDLDPLIEPLMADELQRKLAELKF
jgi:peptide chain release factor 1